MQQMQPRGNLIEEAGLEDMDEEQFEAMQAALIHQMEAEGEEFVVPDDNDPQMQALLHQFAQEEEKKGH